MPLLLRALEMEPGWKGDLPWARRRRRKTTIRSRDTMPAATPVVMPAIEAFFSWREGAVAVSLAAAEEGLKD